jgi:hypothetical protein
MTVRTLTIQSATNTSQYWVMALVDIPSNSTCSPSDYSIVIDGTGEAILFNWTIGGGATTITFATGLVPSTSGQYLAIYIGVQSGNTQGTISYQNPVQK